MIKQNNNHISVPIKREPGWNDSSCIGISENNAIEVDSSTNSSDESDDSRASNISNENNENEDNNDTSEREHDKFHNDEELSDEENSIVDFDAIFNQTNNNEDIYSIGISFSNEEGNTFNDDNNQDTISETINNNKKEDDKTNNERENTENIDQFSGDYKVASNNESIYDHMNCSVYFFLETIHNMSSLLLF